ncbi:methyltransferase domain-containing protein [Actinomycetes bacterium KLBMP 9797]
MANTVFRTAGRIVKWPLTTLIRPYPRLNARIWDLQYALGLWSYLDRAGGDSLPLDLIARYADRPRILDLGCGTTVNLRLARDRYRHYHGVDISRAAIRRARALRRPDTSFEVADVLAYRPTGTYDVVLLREVLYYFPLEEIPGLLHRLAAALAPGGVIIVSLYDSSPAILDTLRHCGLTMVDELPAPHGTTVVLR